MYNYTVYTPSKNFDFLLTPLPRSHVLFSQSMHPLETFQKIRLLPPSKYGPKLMNGETCPKEQKFFVSAFSGFQLHSLTCSSFACSLENERPFWNRYDCTSRAALEFRGERCFARRSFFTMKMPTKFFFIQNFLHLNMSPIKQFNFWQRNHSIWRLRSSWWIVFW